MRLRVLIGVCLSLGTALSAKEPEFSHRRDLPPLKLAATDLDIILHKTRSFIAAANGPSREQDSIREAVKLGIGGQELEIPHISLASSVAFPKEVFSFSYNHRQPDRPISSVAIELGDYSRRISVSGESVDNVEALSNLLEKDFQPYSVAMGGAKFRRVAGTCLLVTLLMSLMVSSAYWWNTRRYSALGMSICSALGLLLVLVVPWHKFLPGFALYQRYSPFLLVRYAPQICLLSLVATLAGIPLFYFLPRWRERHHSR